jgi:O-antigen biosynthesis protein
MKFSIITPTNNKKYLAELYRSLKQQTYSNWEWILYINGNLTVDNVPLEICKDPNVIIRTDISVEKSSNVGYLKNTAFRLGTGDILVEVDHDDLLDKECLQELYDVYSKRPDVGFVYSDSAVLADEFVPYDKSLGWEFYTYNYNNTDCTVPKSFEPSAASLSTIWWAPDHVRSWRRDVYLQVGGHNEDLSILDDHEIMIRTYLITKFYHIPKPLYIYRIHGGNTWLERNEKIQKGTVDIFYHWVESLAERDAELQSLLKVEISLDGYKKKGYVAFGECDCGIHWDMKSRLPFEDNTVGVIRLNHTLPLVKMPPTQFMNELYRVLSDGGWVFIEVPSTDGRGAWQDPTHITRWNENSFWYYTDKNFSRFVPNANYRFQNFFTRTYFPSEWWKENNIPIVQAQLRAVKSDKRRPNKILI